MVVTRRDFLKYCTTSAGALALTSLEVKSLAAALASGGPTVLWLQGAGCTGCSVSFLNHVSPTAPVSAGDVLINVINLAYHPTLMAGAGRTAVDAARQAVKAGNYLLVVEGGVPTAFGGSTCWAWTDRGQEVTFEQAVKTLAQTAAGVVCVGQCSAYGGIPAAPPNPTGIKSVKDITGLTTINIAGCPPHPDWVVWVVAKLVAGSPIPLDTYGRPTGLFSYRIHDQCPRKQAQEANNFGQHNMCMEELGCRGKQTETKGNCPTLLFNNGSNWCIGADSPCIGCTNPAFPGVKPLFQEDD